MRLEQGLVCMNNPYEVLAVNRHLDIALLASDDMVEPSNWFDDNGDECDPEDAVICIVKQPDEKFQVVDLREFETKDFN